MRAGRGALAGLLLLAGLLGSQPTMAAENPCLVAAREAEARFHIPARTLQAMAMVETGHGREDGHREPWPWTVTINGHGHFYPDRNAAEAAAEHAIHAGAPSVDMGCLQLDWRFHHKALGSVRVGLDPTVNVTQAARYLVTLHKETRSWPAAVARYHSRHPRAGQAYLHRVQHAERQLAQAKSSGKPHKFGKQ